MMPLSNEREEKEAEDALLALGGILCSRCRTPATETVCPTCGEDICPFCGRYQSIGSTEGRCEHFFTIYCACDPVSLYFDPWDFLDIPSLECIIDNEIPLRFVVYWVSEIETNTGAYPIDLGDIALFAMSFIKDIADWKMDGWIAEEHYMSISTILAQTGLDLRKSKEWETGTSGSYGWDYYIREEGDHVAARAKVNETFAQAKAVIEACIEHLSAAWEALPEHLRITYANGID